MEVEIDSKLLLEHPHQLTELVPREFPIVDSDDITYSQFFQQFIMKNQPCLIKNVSNEWESSKLWITDDGHLNFAYLQSKYGETEVTVYNCKEKERIVMKFLDFLDYWAKHEKDEEKSLYLKDWHLKNQAPNDEFYQVPIFFASDWLNEYLVDSSKDDYRFVYMGGKGTWTPFHVDVVQSYSWSTNICGKKRWLLFPPGEEEKLMDRFGNFPEDVNDLCKNVQHFEVLQNAGDAVFVPSNWYHQVWNLEDAISINHNWINGCNIKRTWHLLEQNLQDVKNEIKDCQDMEDFLEHCQVMLRATWNGMDFSEFYTFLIHIARKRMGLLQRAENIFVDRQKLGSNHALFDLLAIQDTLSSFIKHEDIPKLQHFQASQILPENVLKEIQVVLETNI